MNFPSVCTFEARPDGLVLLIASPGGELRRPAALYNIHMGVEYANSPQPVPYATYTLAGTNGTYPTMNGGTPAHPLNARAATLPNGEAGWELAHDGAL